MAIFLTWLYYFLTLPIYLVNMASNKRILSSNEAIQHIFQFAEENENAAKSGLEELYGEKYNNERDLSGSISEYDGEFRENSNLPNRSIRRQKTLTYQR